MLLGDGRYRLEAVTSRRADRLLWRGRDLALARAVSVVTPQAATPPEAISRLRLEAGTGARLNHPGVARIYDYGEEARPAGSVLPFLVTEFLPGPTLLDRLTTPLTVKESLNICAQVASGLASAHATGVAHGTLGPEHVYLVGSEVKLVGFADPAPSWFQERAAGPSADLEALARLLRRCLAGHRDQELPAALRQALRVGLPKEAGRRPSAAELAALLRQLTGPTKAVPSVPRTADLPATVRLSRLATRMLGQLPLPRRTAGPPPRPDRQGHRVIAETIASATPGALAVALLSTQLLGGTGAPVQGDARGLAPDRADCAARFINSTSHDSAFEADLTVTNTGEAMISGWGLGFSLASGHVLTAATAPQWDQHGTDVRISQDDRLAPGASVPVRLRGTAAAPADDQLVVVNGISCTARVFASPWTGGTPVPTSADGRSSPQPTSPALTTRGARRSSPPDSSGDRSTTASGPEAGASRPPTAGSAADAVAATTTTGAPRPPGTTPGATTSAATMTATSRSTSTTATAVASSSPSSTTTRSPTATTAATSSPATKPGPATTSGTTAKTTAPSATSSGPTAS